ncbi:AraC-type DNA-binding protein [Chryseobacterium formosense]|uniref:helix-turn-helix domain-containing protein n=1 Tax=Chryseobacterium formosense TaxID=236814 RepID=UPI00068946F0|nr:helix-turn-helix domain-containing protein [Chryseobacterium formosense]SFT64482.1 AraC-type DNA-binding protein [Chryseobacterium formosense]
MKRYFYIFFAFLSYISFFAQNQKDAVSSEITKATIDKKLSYIKENEINTKDEEKMLLQLRADAEKISYEKGILLSGDYLMTNYNLQRNHTKVVELGNQLKKIIKDKKEDPTGVISSIYRRNALALMYLGLDDESKKDVQKAIFFAKTIENPDRKYLRLTQTYMDMHSHYNNLTNLSDNKSYKDSTLYYLEKSLEAANKIKDNNGEIPDKKKYSEIIYIYLRLGIFYLEYSDEKGNLALAEKNLLTAEKIQKEKPSLPERDMAILLNQLSWLYLEKKEFKKTIDYANQALNLEKQSYDPTVRVESFEFLATAYTEMGDKEKSALFMKKYTNLKDSLNVINKSNANTAMKNVIAETDKDYKENSKKMLFIIGVLILIAGTVTTFLWKRKNRILRQKYEKIIENLNNETSSYIDNSTTDFSEDIDLQEEKNNLEPENSAISQKNTISSETETRILKKLAAFEKSTKFLKKDLTIGLLAGQLNTNSKYLSEIIKHHKSQNFSNYINQLKINFIIHKLYNEPNYREYKISYLADVCGYASPQVFVIAFKKIHGMTPSYFIESLKDDDMSNTNPDS